MSTGSSLKLDDTAAEHVWGLSPARMGSVSRTPRNLLLLVLAIMGFKWKIYPRLWGYLPS